MNHFFRFCVFVALAAVGTSRASAGLVLNTPAGLAAGARFRIAFVTGTTTTGSSSDITSYNLFVNTAADAAQAGQERR